MSYQTGTTENFWRIFLNWSWKTFLELGYILQFTISLQRSGDVLFGDENKKTLLQQLYYLSSWLNISSCWKCLLKDGLNQLQSFLPRVCLNKFIVCECEILFESNWKVSFSSQFCSRPVSHLSHEDTSGSIRFLNSNQFSHNSSSKGWKKKQQFRNKYLRLSEIEYKMFGLTGETYHFSVGDFVAVAVCGFWENALWRSSWWIFMRFFPEKTKSFLMFRCF